MLANCQLIPLFEQEHWEGLGSALGPSQQSPLLQNILAAVRAQGCNFALMESPYIDRDFSASFSAFYASLFRPYSKLCKRVHFFRRDLSDLFAGPDPAAIPRRLEDCASDYLGYVVLRPLAHAPVSRAFLSQQLLAPEAAQEVSVRCGEQVHLLGATIELAGFPLTQQDTRVGACAQASIWMAGRFFHLKHRAPWFSLPEITSSALRPTDSAITRSLPAGSDYLTSDNMVRALRAMGRHPVFYAPHTTSEGDQWGFDPKDVVAQYVDSGIPVILGLNDGHTVGHAVVAVGTKRRADVDIDALPDRSSQAAFCSHFLIMDDQRGAYLQLPIEGNPEAQIPFVLRDHLRFMIVPLPNKVFMTSEVAETIARGLIGNLAAQIDHLRAQLPEDKREAWPPERAFYERAVQGKLIARTYLTYGWKYKSRAVRNHTSTTLKREVLKRDFPRYVWVTEFSFAEETRAIDPCARIVRAHVVTDATGSRFWESTLVIDSPGVVVTWDFNPKSDDATASQSLCLSDHSSIYFPKIRGAEGFEACVVAANAAAEEG